MDRQIEDLMKQGLSRREIFEQLKKQSGNQMRLANKIATLEPGSPSRQTVLLNRFLLILCQLCLFLQPFPGCFNRGCSVGDFRGRACIFSKGSTVSSHGVYGCEEG